MIISYVNFKMQFIEIPTQESSLINQQELYSYNIKVDTNLHLFY